MRCRIEGAIIDKNARIGDGIVITPEGKPANVDGENYCIRDGAVVVPKGTVIPAGTLILSPSIEALLRDRSREDKVQQKLTNSHLRVNLWRGLKKASRPEEAIIRIAAVAWLSPKRPSTKSHQG